jgi:hypothetical protein
VRSFLNALVIVITASTGITGEASAQFTAVPNPSLPDIAVAMVVPGMGPVIVYNPFLCQQNLLFCGFTKHHENGHIVPGHVIGSAFPAVAEVQADCYAAQNASQPEVAIAIQVFMAQGNGGDAMGHGTGFQRAQRIQDARTTGQCHW